MAIKKAHHSFTCLLVRPLILPVYICIPEKGKVRAAAVLCRFEVGQPAEEPARAWDSGIGRNRHCKEKNRPPVEPPGGGGRSNSEL
jgi:hypothetical protein